MITNTPSIREPHIEDLRAAIEHRATWFSLLIEEAEKRGLDISFARDAIFRCGCFHGDMKFPQTDDLKTFADAFANENVKKIFEMDPKVDGDTFTISFHYCPLVAAWQKLNIPAEKIEALCDTAMDGDRGIISRYDAFSFELGDTIAKGARTCEIRITKAAGEAAKED